jgi:hypothetical protein
LSFAAGVRTRPGDRFEIECAELGQPLVNTLSRVESPDAPVRVL